MNIGVIGCGYVGLVSAAGFAELGHNVIAAESDAARSKLRQKGQSPFHERHLPELLRKQAGARLQFRQSIEETVRQAKVCVGAPSLRSGETDILDAGIGFGGPCLPKDLHAFRAMSRREGYRIDPRRKSSVSIKANVFTSLRRFAWLCRLSPANALRFLACRLKEEPMTLDNHRLSRSCGICVRKLLRTPIVLDGRNLYSPCQMKAVGLNYISAGRPFALASSSAAECLPLPSPTDNDLWTQDKGSSLGSATQRLPGAII